MIFIFWTQNTTTRYVGLLLLDETNFQIRCKKSAGLTGKGKNYVKNNLVL
jgi:hypothetical protein